MAVGIIDLLKRIQVQNDDGKRMALAGRASDFRREALLGKPAVVQASKSINHGQAAKYERVVLLFGKVPSEPFNKHLLVDGVDIEDDDHRDQSKNRFRNPD